MKIALRADTWVCDAKFTQSLNTLIGNRSSDLCRLQAPIRLDPEGDVQLVALIEFGLDAVDGQGVLAYRITEERRQYKEPVLVIQIISYIRKDGPNSHAGRYMGGFRPLLTLEMAYRQLLGVADQIRRELGPCAA